MALIVDISASGRADLEHCHRKWDWYGNNGEKYATAIPALIELVHACSVIDYGCGKGGAGWAMKYYCERENVSWRSYDPAFHEELPQIPADLVICTHVLEHVEPDHFSNTVHNLIALTNKALFIRVADNSRETAPDGEELKRRRGLLIQESCEGWYATLVNELRKHDDENIQSIQPLDLRQLMFSGKVRYTTTLPSLNGTLGLLVLKMYRGDE